MYSVLSYYQNSLRTVALPAAGTQHAAADLILNLHKIRGLENVIIPHVFFRR